MKTNETIRCMFLGTIHTLTEKRGLIPFSTGSTNWHISLSNTAISRVTLINNLRANFWDLIPQQNWMRDVRRRATVNFYRDENHKLLLGDNIFKIPNTNYSVVVTFARDVRLCPVTINCAQWLIISFILIKSYFTVVSDCASRSGTVIPHLPSVGQYRRIPT